MNGMYVSSFFHPFIHFMAGVAESKLTAFVLTW